MILTLILAIICYRVYKYSCKKKVCRKRGTFPRNQDNDDESEKETLFDRYKNLGENRTVPRPTSDFLGSGRKGKTVPKKTDNDWESETLCGQFKNLGLNPAAPPTTSDFLGSGNHYKKAT